MAQKTVLVVDNDPSILVVVCLALRRQGYAVVTAVGGAAVPLAAKRQPDVILLDIQMPGMDGPEVSRRLRADPATLRWLVRSNAVSVSAGASVGATPRWLVRSNAKLRPAASAISP